MDVIVLTKHIPFSVSQMVVDRICTIKSSDSSKCVNQDVLFMGTGKYLMP